MLSTITKRTVATLTAAAVVAGTLGGGALIKRNKDNVVFADDMAEAEQIAAGYHSSTSGKIETVYVIGSGDGQRITYVSTWLKNPDGSDSLNDISDLRDIEVVKGDAAISSNNNGSITWNANGEDIYYRGISDDELPVDVALSFELDGHAVSSSELEGQSGHLTITVEYINNMSRQVVTEEGDKHTIYMPFVMSTGMILDNSTYSNIEVEGGSAVNDGDRTIIMGIGMPGLYDSLGLDSIEAGDPEISSAIENIDITDKVTIECDAEDCGSITALTVASVLDLDKIETSVDTDEINKKTDDMTDGMRALIDGSTALYDGVSTLNNGAHDLNDGAARVADGASRLSDGAASLSQGADTLSEGTASLTSGASSLQAGISQVNDGTSQLNAGLSQVQSNIPALQSGVSDLTNGASALDRGANALSTGIDTLYGQITSEESSASVNALISGSASFASSLSQLNSSLSTSMTPEQAQALQNAIEYLTAYEEETDDPAAAASIDALISAYTSMAGQMGNVKSAVSSLNEGYAPIDSGINALGGRFGDIASAVASIQTGASSVAEGSARISNGLNALNNSTGALAEGIDSLAAGASALNNGTSQLVAGSSALLDGANRVNSGAHALANGADELSDGANTLSQGTNDLADGTDKLANGVSSLLDGTGSLKDGLNEFNDQAVDKLVDLISSLTPVQDRIDELKEYAASYTSFSGVSDGVDDSAVFVFKND